MRDEKSLQADGMTCAEAQETADKWPGGRSSNSVGGM